MTNCCNDENGEGKRKLKVLALHGYRQNAEVFRQKTGSFRKLVHKWVQFTYITAPHKVYLVDDIDNAAALESTEGVESDQYGWFFNRDNKTYRGIRKGGPAIGFEESVKFVEEVFEKEGPFDGILGFSQGGCFLGLLCDLESRGLLNFKFKFAIISSGFKSDCLPHKKCYGDEIRMPTLHIFGRNDNVIPTEMSADLANAFEEPAVVEHSGGHYLPASAEQKSAYHKFIKSLHSALT